MTELNEHLVVEGIIKDVVVKEDVYTYKTATHNLKFQKGDPQTEGRNGLTDEELLIIMIDRAREWSKGEFATRENSISLTHLENALLWKQKRTRERATRNVLGTYEK